MTKPKTAPSLPAATNSEIVLTGNALTLFNDVSARWKLDPVATQLLRLACESLKRSADCAAITAVEGLTLPDRMGRPKAHPAALLERDHRNAAANSLQKLGLSLE